MCFKVFKLNSKLNVYAYRHCGEHVMRLSWPLYVNFNITCSMCVCIFICQNLSFAFIYRNRPITFFVCYTQAEIILYVSIKLNYHDNELTNL